LLALKSVCCIASATAKRDEAGLVEYASRLDVPLHFFESSELNRTEFPSPPSAHALAAIGASGVAEPAAILASRGGRLLLKKVKSENVTLAVAEIKGSKCTTCL
jgi:cobalt-precorrin 5A hydrolase